MNRPDRFSRNIGRLGSLSAHGLRWIRVTVKPVRSGVVESLRGRNSAFEPREAERQIEGLFESLLAESFNS
jgi:hypothetical protein